MVLELCCVVCYLWHLASNVKRNRSIDSRRNQQRFAIDHMCARHFRYQELVVNVLPAHDVCPFWKKTRLSSCRPKSTQIILISTICMHCICIVHMYPILAQMNININKCESWIPDAEHKIKCRKNRERRSFRAKFAIFAYSFIRRLIVLRANVRIAEIHICTCPNVKRN